MRVRTIFLFALIAVGVTALPTFAQQPGNTDSDLFPPNAQPGECYARVFVPPVYATDTENVLVREASTRIEVVPARYEWVEERVLVKEASQKLVVVPGTYEKVDERVMTKPETKKLVTTAAEFETVTEKVLDRPEHTVWKKGANPLQAVGAAGGGAAGGEGTGEIMCLVTVPAAYKTVTRRVLRTPASTKEIIVPAEYKTVKKQVVGTPPTTRTIEIPAEYATIKVYKEVTPPTTKTIEIPSEYDTVNKRKLVRDGHMAWEPVLCETNANRATVMDIQRALKTAGHNPGAIDGVIGRDTLVAVHAFQSSKGLPTGGLTLETIRALGVTMR